MGDVSDAEYPVPDGVVAFLVTDLVDDGDRQGRRPGTPATAVVRHHTIIGEAVIRHGGVSASREDAGDSTVSAFARVSDALRAGVEAQRALATEPWPTTTPLRARMAVHAGEVDRDETGRYVGFTLHRARQLLAAVNAGQLVVSGPAADLITSPPVPDVELVDLGAQRLPALGHPLRVVEVRGDGLVEARLRTIDGVRNNLPVAATDLIGREQLMAELTVPVATERLVCLTGAGGCGKTRLALELSGAAVARFGDGVWWTDLGAATGDEAIDEAAALAIGTHPTSTQTRRDRVLGAVGSGEVLVVLDNCEHLLDEVAGFVTALLGSCPRAHVLATSREPLGLAGEVVRRVPSLDLPATDDVEAVLASGAGRFLVDRLARAAGPPTLDPREAAALATICRRLDGIPLALELAAARARTMSLDELCEGLSERFRLLSGGRRDALDRQRTLEASVAWSHDLLTGPEQVVLRRLAVFPSDFTIGDAEAVVGIDDGSGVEEGVGPSGRELVGRLVDRSLLTVAPDGSLRMLETVRAFAEHRLVEAGEVLPTRGRHLEAVRRWAEAMEPAFDGPDPQRAIAETEGRLVDVRVALRHAEATGDAGAIWAIVGGLANYWWYRGHLREALDWLARAEALDPDLPAEAQLSGRSAAALLSTAVGEHDGIVEAAEAAIATAKAAGDPRLEGRALILLGAHQTWHDDTGRPIIARGRALCAGAGDHLWAAWADCSGALASVLAGRPLDAMQQLDDVRAVVERSGSRRLHLDVLARQVCAELQLGAWRDARATADAGLDLARDFATINVVACFHGVTAWIDALTGEADRAEAAMREAIDRYLRDEELQFIPFFVTALGHALLAQDRADEAIAAADMVRAHPDLEWASIYRSWLDDVLALSHLASGADGEARRFASRMAAQAKSIGNDLERARAETTLAILDRRAGEHRRAEGRAHDALETLAGLGADHWAVDALEVIALLDLDADRVDRATALLATAGAQRSARGVMHRPGWEADFASATAGVGSLPESEARDLAAAVELAARGRGERGRPTAGWDSLTPTELRVVELVADGLANPAIAERLLMGRATVKTHVSSALRKLDLQSRTQLATAHTTRAASASASDV